MFPITGSWGFEDFSAPLSLLAQVRLAGQEVGFLIHVEAHSSSKAHFARRMFFNFARLHQNHLQRIYPIVVFSFDEPYRQEANQYVVEFDDFEGDGIQLQVIELNRLNWRDFINQPNPIAAALMSEMKIEPADRPRVKVECLRVLATLQLNPARTKLISGFVDTYLRLNVQEEQVFQEAVCTLEGVEREGIMEIVKVGWNKASLKVNSVAEPRESDRSSSANSLVA